MIILTKKVLRHPLVLEKDLSGALSDIVYLLNIEPFYANSVGSTIYVRHLGTIRSLILQLDWSKSKAGSDAWSNRLYSYTSLTKKTRSSKQELTTKVWCEAGSIHRFLGLLATMPVSNKVRWAVREELLAHLARTKAKYEKEKGLLP